MSELVYLKVKIKSLAAEAAIIRREERRFRPRWKSVKDETYLRLRGHRTMDVRQEARSAQLAYALLRERRYLAIESKCYDKVPFSRIADLIEKYGDRTFLPERKSDQNRHARTTQLVKFVMDWTKAEILVIANAP